MSTELPVATVMRNDVFSSGHTGSRPEYLVIESWDLPVQYFVGRNGSGKSRTAKALCQRVGGRLLSTDRLAGIMSFTNFSWGSAPSTHRGVPLDPSDRQSIDSLSRQTGVATVELYALREEPEVWLRVAAFIRRVLGRSIELRETAGFLDPYVRIGAAEYSLLRDEGHGLRELVVLLAATYRRDWPLLVVDEPELHLHPSLARLWLTELNRECIETGRNAIVVTHEPSLLRPTSIRDLGGIWLFSSGCNPQRFSDYVLPVQEGRVEASLAENPTLVSDIIFSPRPVLVEGPSDLTALSMSMSRTQPAEVTAQTDVVHCGGSGGVALWLEICTKLGLDVRAIVDLDALFSSDFQRAVGNLPGIREALLEAFAEDPPTLNKAVQALIIEANRNQIGTSESDRSSWLAQQQDVTSAVGMRKSRILDLLKEFGVWVHPQGAIEQVLNIDRKGVREAQEAARLAGALDDVAAWAAYELDLAGDVKSLLEIAVERIAHSVMQAQRSTPEAEFGTPVGINSESDSRLVTVRPAGQGRHIIEVIAPKEFEGYWLEFSRETRAVDLQLNPPRGEL